MLEPREYQKKIFDVAKENNTLVVLPTGLGKTLIAFLLSKYHLEKYPKEKVLFLAPTRPLVNQHFDHFKKNLPELFAEVHMITGKINAEKRGEIWETSNVIISTPQCIANDLRHGRISLDEVSLLIEDEAHRCLKNYDYNYIANNYLKDSKSSNKRILAMTASPGSDSKTIKQICENLGIQKIESRSRESEDVKPYLQELKTTVLRVEYPEYLSKIRDLLKEVYLKKTNELKNRSLLFGPASKKNLLDLQKKLVRQISTGRNNFNALRGMSVCAQAIKLNHAIELIETQGVSQTYRYLKLVLDEASKGKSKAVKEIANNSSFMQAFTETTKIIGRVEHPKLDKLLEIVKELLLENKNSKIIVFAHFRDTVSLINKKLREVSGVKSEIFIGQSKRDEQDGLSQKEQQFILNKFRSGETNTLIATSIGEEGLDLPEVSCVIFYEPVPSAIRKIQRAGRTARLHPGKLIILMTSKTKDEVHHWASHHKEKKMHQSLEDLKNKLDLESGKKEGQETLF